METTMVWSVIALLLLGMVPCSVEAKKVTLKQPADIVLVVDDSTSIQPDQFKALWQAVQTFPDKIDMSDGKVRVGVVTFETSGKVILDLTNDENAVRSLSPKHGVGETWTSEGLKEANKMLAGARAEARKIAILITDGHSDMPELAEAEAEKLRKQDVTLMAVHVGESMENKTWEHMEKMTTDEELVKSIDKFDGLTEYLEHAMDKLRCFDWGWEDDQCNETNAGQIITINRNGSSVGYEHCTQTKEILCPVVPTTTITAITTSILSTTTEPTESTVPTAATVAKMKDTKTDPNEEKAKARSLEPWMIAVIVAGACVLVTIIIVIVAVVATRKKRKRRQAVVKRAKEKANFEGHRGRKEARRPARDNRSRPSSSVAPSSTTMPSSAVSTAPRRKSPSRRRSSPRRKSPPRNGHRR